MKFLIIMLNVFGLTALIVLWLSISFIAFDIYKSGKNRTPAVSLARISNIIRLIIGAWFIFLGIAFLTADNILPFILYLVLFIGLYYYIYHLYGNILRTVTVIRKDDGSEKFLVSMQKTLSVTTKHSITKKQFRDFNKFKKFFLVLDSLICIGALLNFWLMDTGGDSFLGVAFASVLIVLFLQVLFLPIYFISKKIVFATLLKT